MIHMQQELSKINYKYSSGIDIEEMKKLRKLKIFSDEVCLFLNQLSRELLKDSEARGYSDLITFGYYCRKSNIEKLKAEYSDIIDKNLGKGISFHIAPSNVPINFAYSMVVGLLSGNSCIVKASSKNHVQTDIICRVMKKVLKETNSILKDYIVVLSYDNSKEINDYLSSLCSSRVIWGGDNTIMEIRKSPIPARANEITFADRYSLAVFNAEAIIQCNEIEKLVLDFYNDTYLYDQNACSSPQLIIWQGEKEIVEKAKKIFWTALNKVVIEKYTMDSVLAIDKMLASYKCSILMEGTIIINGENNLIKRVQLEKLNKEIINMRCPGGFFLEYDSLNLNDLYEIVTNKYQTLSYYGVNPEAIRSQIIDNGIDGIDRIVPVGKTSDFSLVWDGYDLIRQLSRICYL